MCAKASPGYIGRSDTCFGILFYVLLIAFVSLAYIWKNHPRLSYGAYMALFFALCMSMNNFKNYRESTMGNNAPKDCVAVDNFIIEQVVSAVNRGEKEMVLIVPKGDNRDNWPHPKYMGAAVSRTLYTHGIINRQITIKIKPDVSVNKKYNISIPK